MQGCRDFGSFHVSNVQDLLAIPEVEYKPPSLPLSSEVLKEVNYDDFQFGKIAREKYFLLEPDCVFLNHGAFGGALKSGVHAAQAWQLHIERQPVRFMDRELMPHLVFITRRLAKLVGCKALDLVLVNNVTTAMNSVLYSQHLKPGEIIYHFFFEYGANKKLFQRISEETGAKVQEVSMSFPIKDEQQVIDLLSFSLEDGTKLAVFDHIPSNTPFILPIKEMVQICHKKNVKVLVDGAHVLGQIELNLDGIGADFYTGNCHKWFSSPKGAAFLHVAPDEQSTTRPLLTSHGFGSGFNSEYIWTGLHDYSPFLSLHAVIDFWEAIGVKNILKHNHTLAVDAANMLVEKWNSKLLAPLNMCGSMLCVQLPQALYSHLPADQVTYSKAELVQNALFHQFGIEVPMKAIQGDLYVRLSAHVYNTLDEYSVLANAILQLSGDNKVL